MEAMFFYSRKIQSARTSISTTIPTWICIDRTFYIQKINAYNLILKS